MIGVKLGRECANERDPVRPVPSGAVPERPRVAILSTWHPEPADNDREQRTRFVIATRPPQAAARAIVADRCAWSVQGARFRHLVDDLLAAVDGRG